MIICSDDIKHENNNNCTANSTNDGNIPRDGGRRTSINDKPEQNEPKKETLEVKPKFRKASTVIDVNWDITIAVIDRLFVLIHHLAVAVSLLCVFMRLA